MSPSGSDVGRPVTWILSAAALACREDGPLPDTPITGGTREQVALAREELRAFDQNVGEGRVRVPVVRFEESVDRGRIRVHSHLVTLDDDLPPEDVRWILRHELCHALDDAEDLVGESALFDDLAEGFFADDDPDAVDDAYPTDRRKRGEALATFCSLGALPTHALRTGCRTEPDVLPELADWLMDEVWRAFPERDVAWDRDGAQGWQSTQFPNSLSVRATGSPEGGIRIRVWRLEESDTPYETVVVGLHDGKPVDLFGMDVWVEPLAPEAPAGLADDLSSESLLGWPDGAGAALGRVDLWHLGPSQPRLFATDASGEWASADPGCPLAHQQLFTAEGAVWTAWVDGTTVRWAKLSW